MNVPSSNSFLQVFSFSTKSHVLVYPQYCSKSSHLYKRTVGHSQNDTPSYLGTKPSTTLQHLFHLTPEVSHLIQLVIAPKIYP